MCLQYLPRLFNLRNNSEELMYGHEENTPTARKADAGNPWGKHSPIRQEPSGKACLAVTNSAIYTFWAFTLL